MADLVTETFDIKLAEECASAFHGATGVGCLVSGSDHSLYAHFGHNCSDCRVCEAAGRDRAECILAQNFALGEAERFGGKYIFYCPMGLTCFISPISGEIRSSAMITAGPFLMVDKQDYLDCELSSFDEAQQQTILTALEPIPVIPASRVNQLSTLLFMAVGFMNKTAQSRFSDALVSDALQGHITTYIMQLKNELEPEMYPYDKEKALLKSIVNCDKDEAHRLLNELMGHILFSTGRNFELVKSRIAELLALIGRAAIDAGGNVENILSLSHEYRLQIADCQNIEELCLWLSETLNRFMDSIFKYDDLRHGNAIHRCIQYIEAHYSEKLTIQQLSRVCYLSPNYLSRIFHEEMGTTLSTYLNHVRVTKAKAFLRHGDLRLIDIAAAVGFEDPSYFTKVFKRITGVNPLAYRTQTKEKAEK